MKPVMNIALASGSAQSGYEQPAVELKGADWINRVDHLRVEFNRCIRRQSEQDEHL